MDFASDFVEGIAADFAMDFASDLVEDIAANLAVDIFFGERVGAALKYRGGACGKCRDRLGDGHFLWGADRNAV